MASSSLSYTPWVLIALSVLAGLAIAACAWIFVRLTDSQHRRRELERLLDLLTETARDYALWVMSASGRIMQWSAGAEHMHGYGADDMIGRHSSNLYTEADRSANVPQKMLELAARLGSHAFAVTRVRKDGGERRVESTLHALRDESGRLNGFCQIDHDVSERLQLDQALQQTRATLVQAHKLEAIGRLSGGVAHDFNNVVQVIKNCVRVLQRRLADQPALLQSVDMIERNADRAASLSQHLLGVARLESLDPGDTNVHEVVQDAVQMLRQTFNEGIALEHRLADGEPWTSIERGQLEAALLNLAANARDAMPYGGTLSIETLGAPLESEEAESQDSEHYVAVTVSHLCRAGPAPAEGAVAGGEGGAAAPPQDAAALALTQVQQLLEQSGGRVAVEMQRGSSRVTLWLPRVRPPGGRTDARRDRMRDVALETPTAAQTSLGTS